jgi:DNA-binding PadR family transcriptional regulator
MTKNSGTLTELEGAVLSEIHHRGNHTAFRVRRAFQTSPSIEWSGSAGAVYPAIRRLVAGGLILSTPIPTGRRGDALALTPEGVRALERWICDPLRAASVGLDPFRLRAGLWATLAPAVRDAALDDVKRAIADDLDRLTAALDTLDPVERARSDWSIRLQRMRAEWLEAQGAAS